MIEDDILFIFGAPRSGTTYVNNLLRIHFDFGLCSEAHWVLHIAKRLNKYGDLQVDGNLRQLIDDVREDVMFEYFRTIFSRRFGRPLDVTAEDVWRNLPERSYPGVIYSVFASVAEQLRKKRVGNKCPPYWKGLGQLLDWFPNAKFLHIIRDGRDVALSTITKPWGQKSAFACAQAWVRVQEAAHRFLERVPSHQYHTVYYEQLLEKPEVTVCELERFLDVSVADDVKEIFLRGARENDKRRNFGKWRDRMSQHDLRIYEAVAGDWLARHGYECVVDEPVMSRLERTVYMCHELGRKVKQTLIAGAQPVLRARRY